MPKLEEYRPEGARNFFRVGDVVRVVKGGADKVGFDARVLHIVADDEGKASYFDLHVLTGKYRGLSRSIQAERVHRKEQTKQGQVKVPKR